MIHSRRTFLAQVAHVATTAGSVGASNQLMADEVSQQLPHEGFVQRESQSLHDNSLSERVAGLLIGGILGDALGGPVEFGKPAVVNPVLPNTRAWSADRRLTETARKELAETLNLFGYETLRPEPAPYGPWLESAPAGTVTDDTRHKIVLMRTLAAALATRSWPISARQIAEQIIAFQPRVGTASSASIRNLCRDGMKQYRYAARWLLGERDLSQARPIERLWAGIDNCSGQMMLPPLAAVYPGQPEDAYRAAFALDFIDTPGARDIAAALVAGLASVLAPECDSMSVEARWRLLRTTIRNTDPFGFVDVPFAGRPLHKWMDLAESIARRAEGRPHTLFQLLESEAQPVYWWDAHFTLLCPLAILQFCDDDVLAALHLTLDFGHDTDSYAQVIGCLGGAVHGPSIFPPDMRAKVRGALQRDYGETLTRWQSTLADCRARRKDGLPFVESK